MELSWLTRIKIMAVLALAVTAWGVYMWRFVAPTDPMGIVTLAGNTISAGTIAIIIIAAFVAGFVGYFIGWPYGREIGILAAPAGLAAWAARSGDIAEFMQTHPAVAQRHSLYQSLGWEPLVWFAVATAGYGGAVIAAQLIKSSGVPVDIDPPPAKPQTALNAIISTIIAAAIATAAMSMLAKNVVFADKNLGAVIGQPANGQIAFAVLISFGLAAFVVKKFQNAGYAWPCISTVIVSFSSAYFSNRGDTLAYMAGNWPTAFFPNASCAMLPIQIISFGILGSIWGYWLAVRFTYWQQHHAKG